VTAYRRTPEKRNEWVAQGTKGCPVLANCVTIEGCRGAKRRAECGWGKRAQGRGVGGGGGWVPQKNVE